MTVVAAIAREGRVVMAADTSTHADTTRFLSTPKIVRYGEDVLLAAAGNAAILVSLRMMEMPELLEDLDEWAIRVAELATTTLLERVPASVKTGPGAGGIMGNLLLGYAGRLWYVDANLASPCYDGIGVIGSGADVAYGALRMLDVEGHRPGYAVRRAVEIACERDAACALVEGVPQVETA